MSRAPVALRYFLRVLSLAVFWCMACSGTCRLLLCLLGFPKGAGSEQWWSLLAVFCENEDSWRQNVNMKPSQECYTLEESKPLAKRRDEERFNFVLKSSVREVGVGSVAFHNTVPHESQRTASGVLTDLLLTDLLLKRAVWVFQVHGF